MKKVLLFLAAALLPALSFTQNCVRDSNLLKTGTLLSPAPWEPDTPYYNLKTACIGEAYSQSVTVNVPATYTFMGITIPISNVSIATSNAIGNYPAGMTYSCDPPNCVFNPSTLGCIYLNGTPSANNPAPDTLDLEISANIATPFGPFVVKFPGDVGDSSHYYLILKPNGQCASATTDAGSPFSAVKAMPNPFSQQTVIDVQSTQTGTFRFEVFDLLGHRLHTQTVQLYEGANQFSYDASALPAGTFIYAIGNAAGRSVRRMVKE